MIAELPSCETPCASQAIEQFMPMAKSIAGRLCHREGDCDSLISVGYMAILKALRTYDSTRSSLSTYMYIRIRGDILNEIKRELEWYEVHKGGGHLDNNPQHGTTPHTTATVNDCLSCLSERELRIVEMKYGIGRPPGTLKDISAVEGCSRERVWQITRRAVNKMKRMQCNGESTK